MKPEEKEEFEIILGGYCFTIGIVIITTLLLWKLFRL